MKLRFMQTTASDSPEYPFQAGQIIEVPGLTRTMRGWLRDGWAVLVDEPEAAVMGAAPERATVARPRARGKR